MPTMLDRTLGFFPMSIATSLAFEGVTHLGEYGDRPGEPEINQIETIWCNLRTLIRNAIGAFTTEEFNRLEHQTVIDSVADDWEQIRDRIGPQYPQCEFKLYCCDYQGLDRAFPNAYFKSSETPKQMLYESMERAVLLYFHEQFKEELLIFDWKLNGSKRTTLLSHLPIDLLSYHGFPDLQLLESHTGVIKTRRQWASKLQLDKSVTVIPFNRATLAIFGDGVMFRPQPIKPRRVLIQIGEKRNWNSMTTMSRMVEDVKLAYEPFLVEFLLKYK